LILPTTFTTSKKFKEVKKHTSEPIPNNSTYVLQIKSGNSILSAGLETPLTYWTMQKDKYRKTNDKDDDVLATANISDNL